MQDQEFVVENAMRLADVQTQNGTFAKYTIQAGGQTGEMLQKPETPAPKTGDKLFGHFEDSQWGKKFKKGRPMLAGGGRTENPERQASIERQNALTNAVNYCVAKAGMMDKKDGLKWLTGKEVIQVATYFARYSKGLVTVVNMNDEKPPLPLEPEGPVDEPRETQVGQAGVAEGEKAGSQEIGNVNELPF